MNINQIKIGDKVPEVVNVIIEIPAEAAPVKYEIDKDSGAVCVDRFINVPMFYPCNYGFIPHTLSEDGDPTDVLVVTPVPIIAGSVIAARPIGGLEMTDESGRDIKLIAVPADKMNSGYDTIQEASDLPEQLLNKIKHFFEHYKALEPGKWVKVEEWFNRDKAYMEIKASAARVTNDEH